MLNPLEQHDALFKPTKTTGGVKSSIIRFHVMKVNKYNKNSKRALDLDVQTNTLSVCKKSDDDDSEVILNANTLVGLQSVPDKPKELTIVYFKSQERLLRNQKSLVVLFTSPEERERFYRLTQLHILSKANKSDKLQYVPSPLRITSQDVKMRFKTQKFPIEQISAQIHNSWMLKRLDEGWSFGKVLDEKKKTHPALIRYEELDSSEQARNVQLVSITLETIYALGFEIELDKVASENKTGDTAIAGELLQLVEFLSENMHDIWAGRKIEEGWKYGRYRDNESKLHPNLIPYYELSEADKELDREGSRNILSGLIEQGYKISKVDNGSDEKTKK
eukprot:TRINITY_DN7664_c0_g1_i3.p1 TRINITY_DN7664_c0_g1~~TRINITY_DN7664_c0_g1_i3.p1  ORF type:complete len:334 (-),score=84.05 TRINITY_DN7664_c0_g1_i3:34-1035(-)